MSKILNAIKKKVNILNRNPKLKIMLISALALLLIFSVTLAWYINKVEIFGMEFQTGTIEFNTYVYDQNGVLKATVSSEEEDVGKYMNESLIRLTNGNSGSILTGYIGVESVGTLGIDYQVLFGIEGLTEKNYAFLGGYKYKITDVTEQIGLNSSNSLNGDISVPSKGSALEEIKEEAIVIDRNAIRGTLEEKNDYHVYRIEFCLPEHVEEYSGDGIKIYFNIKAVQQGGDFDSDEERGKIWNCASDTDINKVKVEAYPGDIIRLTKDISYYGDLVFNKPVTIETNDHTFKVYGNLMYDYALSTSLKIDAGGKGVIQVLCTVDGIGGNFQIKAPMGDVTIIGSNASAGDIVVEKNIILGSTNAYGANGLILNTVKFLDPGQGMKAVYLESNTRATVAFDTTIGILSSTANANYIEIENNGTILDLNLSNMKLLPTYENINNQSPQIYILNNSIISKPIALPSWSVKFVELANGKFEGNTRIIQGITASTTKVSGNCNFSNEDVEKERTDILVEQIEKGKDNRLRIYYQDIEGQPANTIESILRDYLQNQATTGITLSQIEQLEIISIDGKTVTLGDIEFMNGRDMLYLKNLNLQRADVYDAKTDSVGRLPDNAFYDVSKYETLILPQNLVAIGANAFASSEINSIITIPAGVTEFGNAWFLDGLYVRFAASIPPQQPKNALSGVQAIFVDEAYISSYKTDYTDYATRIYPVSVMDERKEHFVRNTKNDEWEITYYISGEDTVIGGNITIDGTKLNITSVYDNAYRHNYTATDVVLADSVVNLGSYNFYGSSDVETVQLNKLQTLGDAVFYNAIRLYDVSFGDSLQTIGAMAFMNCKSLTQAVILPDTMVKIGSSAFQNTPIPSVNTGGTVSIDGSAFRECLNLLYAEMPSVKIIGEDGSNLLFYKCTSLVCVSMPSLIKAYGEQMFAYCKSVRELYMGANDDGITLGGNTFFGGDKTRTKIFVPEAVLEMYQTKQPGGISSTMIYPEGEKMGELPVNGFNIGTYIVRNNGDDSYTLITSNIDYENVLVVPEDFDGKPITHLYANAFRNQNISNAVLKIGNNLKSIGDYAFYSCTGLVDIVFGESLENIGAYAFANCSNYTKDMILPNSMKMIGSYAFTKSGILSVNTGGTVSIDGHAFYSCSALVYAELPEVTTLAESGTNYVFRDCKALVSVHMPKVYRVYGAAMFQGCSALRELYMGHDNAEVTLGTQTFVTINSAVIKLFVPEDLVTMYKGRNILPENQVYPIGEKMGDYSVNGYVLGDYIVMKNDTGYTLVTSNLSFAGDVIVPDVYNDQPITEIYTNAFRNQTFTDVNLILGDNVLVIGDSAFNGVKGLKSVAMDNVTTIGQRSFYNSGIELLNGPKVTSIGTEAFRLCSVLETVSLPKMVDFSNNYVLYDCAELKYVYFEDIMSLAYHTFVGDAKLEKVIINRIINDNKDNMPSSMNIPSKVCKIYVPYKTLWAYENSDKQYIWSGKDVLSYDISVTVQGNTYILSEKNGKYILIDFISDGAISSLTIPATLATDEIGTFSVYAIGADAFASVAESMKNITLSASIEQLDNRALSECKALQNIYVDSGNTYFTSVNGILYSKNGKMLVKYPVGREGSFDMTVSAYSATVGITSGAFENASKLYEIVLPGSLSVIDGASFSNCGKLKTVKFTGTTPPTLMGVSIFDTTVEGFVMIVPAGVMDAYVSAYNFSEYESFMQAG